MDVCLVFDRVGGSRYIDLVEGRGDIGSFTSPVSSRTPAYLY